MLAFAGPGASAVEPRASLPDIEDEVMCPTCGTVLAHAFSPQAERQRLFIRSLIEQGRTKEQIKDALVAEFGEDVLATPRDEGFDLIAYLVPMAAVVLAAIGIALGPHAMASTVAGFGRVDGAEPLAGGFRPARTGPLAIRTVTSSRESRRQV